MNSLRFTFGPILVALVLSACGGGQPTDTRAPQSDESAFDPMVETIDKAKAVEGISAGRTEDLEQEIEKSQ